MGKQENREQERREQRRRMQAIRQTSSRKIAETLDHLHDQLRAVMEPYSDDIIAGIGAVTRSDLDKTDREVYDRLRERIAQLTHMLQDRHSQQETHIEPGLYEFRLPGQGAEEAVVLRSTGSGRPRSNIYLSTYSK